MSAFADLQQAGASQDTDELAIVRGESTLRQTVGRVKGSGTSPSRPSVIDFDADRTVADEAGSGNTYNFTGAAGVTLTLPKASTAAAVADGWEIVVRNSGTDSLEIAKQGLDTIDGDNTLTLYAGNSVRLQKTANRAWVTISVDQAARLAAGRAENTADSALAETVTNAAQIGVAQGDATRALNDSAAARAVADSKLSPPAVVIASADTAIPAAARGATYVHTGSSNITYTLPAASGQDAVPNGWEIVVSNQGAGDLTIDGHGSDTIDGEANLVISDNGRGVRLQKIANTVWATIADTKDDSGAAFAPTKENIYAAVKAIFGHNTAVSADDADSELDFATGAAAALNDNSIAAVKARAEDAGDKKAWRLRIGAWHLSVTANSTLPAVTNFNAPDGVLLGQSGDTTVQFADISDRSTMITEGVAGDLMLIFGRGWVRVTNIFNGGAPLAAVRAIAEANAARVNRMTVFETASLNPPGIPDSDFPEFLGLELSNKIDPRRIVSLRVRIGGQQVAASVDAATLAPFNDTGSAPLTQPGRGGILNLTLDETARQNLKNASPQRIQYVVGEIEYKFEGTSLQPDVLPDAIDHFFFAVNNNGYPAISGLSQAQVDARVRALRSETVVGASPAVLPAGTYELALVGKPGNNARTNYVPMRLLVSDIPAADRRFFFRADAGDEFYITMRYAAATRTLTYSTSGHTSNGTQAVSLISIKAIGGA